MQVHCPTNPPLTPSELKVGAPCYCCYGFDNLWYRAKILKINGTKCTVLYVDFGNEDVVEANTLKHPEVDHVLTLRPQAIECCLNGYQKLEPDQQRDSVFEELVLEKEFDMKVVELQDNTRILVELINKERYNVASLLVQKLSIAKSQASPLLVQEDHKIDHRRHDVDSQMTDHRNNKNFNEKKYVVM